MICAARAERTTLSSASAAHSAVRRANKYPAGRSTTAQYSTVQYQEAAKQSLRATSRPHPDRPPPAALSPSLSPAPPPNALVRTTGVRHAAATSPLPAPPPPPPPPPPHLLPRSRPTPFFRHPDASPRRRRRRRGTSRSSRRGRFGRRRRHHQDQDQGRRRLARHGTSSVLDLI